MWLIKFGVGSHGSGVVGVWRKARIEPSVLTGPESVGRAAFLGKIQPPLQARSPRPRFRILHQLLNPNFIEPIVIFGQFFDP